MFFLRVKVFYLCCSSIRKIGQERCQKFVGNILDFEGDAWYFSETLKCFEWKASWKFLESSIIRYFYTQNQSILSVPKVFKSLSEIWKGPLAEGLRNHTKLIDSKRRFGLILFPLQTVFESKIYLQHDIIYSELRPEEADNIIPKRRLELNNFVCFPRPSASSQFQTSLKLSKIFGTLKAKID